MIPMTDSAETNQPSHKKLLVVACTDPLVMDAVAGVLSTWELVCANDDKEALGLVESSPFDLVITAEHSAGREDVELLRKIRMVRPHTRLIILTAMLLVLTFLGWKKRRASTQPMPPLAQGGQRNRDSHPPDSAGERQNRSPHTPPHEDA